MPYTCAGSVMTVLGALPVHRVHAMMKPCVTRAGAGLQGGHSVSETVAIFLDDGGVINDNGLRGAEWRRLVAEFFIPVLGGDRSSWMEANLVVFERLEPMLIGGPKGRDYGEWYDSFMLDWLREMTDHVGVDRPVDDADCIQLAWQASDYITSRVRSSFPGVDRAIRDLSGMGFRLFTASAEHSRELAGYLEGIGVRESFDCLYGPDLVNAGKISVDYYRRIFAHAGVSPEHALVVDDRLHNLDWAATLGATTCLITDSQYRARADFIAENLGDLVSALHTI